MDVPNIWEHKYKLQDKLKNYKVELVNYHPDDYNPEDPSEFIKVRGQLDKDIEEFLDAYHKNPLVPMKFEVMGKAFKISMEENDKIAVEKLHERKRGMGY